jgi:CAAX protease family protein
MSLFFVAGEEIGWRGYMLTRLIDSQLPYPLLIHGLIWSAYHIPLIIGGAYSAAVGSSIILSVIMFTIIATSFSYLLAWLRLDTGIIWPSFVAHAVSNALTQNAFNPVTQGDNKMLWIGESGIVTAVVLILLIFLVKKMCGFQKHMYFKEGKTYNKSIEPTKVKGLS